MRNEKEGFGAGAGHWYGCDLQGKKPGSHIWLRFSLHAEHRRTLFACNACNSYFCFLGIDGWMAERTDGRTDEKFTPVYYTNWHLMQRIGSWLAITSAVKYIPSLLPLLFLLSRVGFFVFSYQDVMIQLCI